MNKPCRAANMSNLAKNFGRHEQIIIIKNVITRNKIKKKIFLINKVGYFEFLRNICMLYRSET